MARAPRIWRASSLRLMPPNGRIGARRRWRRGSTTIWAQWERMHGDNRPLTRSKAGPRRDFDYNLDGMAHYGMLPDFLQDLSNVGLTAEDLAPLFRSAYDYIEMWSACDAGARRSTEVPAKTATEAHDASMEVSDEMKTLRGDIQAIFDRDPAARNTLEVLFLYPGLHAIWLHRLAHALWRNGFTFLGRLVSNLSRWVTGIEIHPGAQIGPGLFHRSRHGHGDRRDRRDRRERDALP